MTYCQNCGHESHCGIPLLKDEYNYKNELLGQIEVCKCCRCENCSASQGSFAHVKNNDLKDKRESDMFKMENEGI